MKGALEFINKIGIKPDYTPYSNHFDVWSYSEKSMVQFAEAYADEKHKEIYARLGANKVKLMEANVKLHKENKELEKELNLSEKQREALQDRIALYKEEIKELREALELVIKRLTKTHDYREFSYTIKRLKQALKK